MLNLFFILYVLYSYFLFFVLILNKQKNNIAMLKSIKSFTKKVDIFGVGIHLKINQESKAKILIGGSLTIILSFFLISMFFL